MSVVEAVLALIGLLALVSLVVHWQLRRRSSEPPLPIEADLAAPYREGLYAAMRMQATAQDLEQQMYARAIKNAEAQSAPQRGVRYGAGTCTKSKN